MVQVTMRGVRATKDAEKIGDKGMYKFSVAHNNGKDKDGNDRQPDFYEVVMFGKVAERYANRIKKGQALNIEGTLTTGEYVKNDVKVPTVSVILNYAEPCAYWPKEDGSAAPTEETPSNGFVAVEDDGNPFN